ncbi:MAG: serine/threonine-protein kinase [Polyangiaceae bacterium]
MNLAGRVLAGRYQLNRRLAEGGMGSIWMAKHLALGVNVAVKIMNGDGAARSDLRKRFEQEARAVAMLRSPNVISVIDYGTDQDLPFIVMELLEGIDLLTLLQSAGKWPVPEVANLVLQISKGLSAAHELGLIHRDVKPGNIFCVRSGTDVVVKLLDFGIAKWTLNGVAEQNLTDANVVLGSPYYMSPEQLRCLPLDGRADVWALSVVAYRLITGDLPFTGRDGPEIASRILTRDRKKIQPPIPRALELERFMSRAFAEDPAARFRDAKDFAEQFILVAGVPAHLRIAERALTSDEEIIPTINLRRDSRSDAMLTPAQVVEEVKQQVAQLKAPAAPPRPVARTQRMVAMNAPPPQRVASNPGSSVNPPRPVAVSPPYTAASADDSVTNVRHGEEDAIEEPSTADRGETSAATQIGTLDDFEDTVTDLPFPGTG